MMDERDGEGGFTKRVNMNVVEDGDTCDEVVENGFVGGYSIFDIPFSSQMNIQLRSNRTLDLLKRFALQVLQHRNGSNR